jgi:hypothetical protein
MARCSHGFELTQVECPMGCGVVSKSERRPYRVALTDDLIADALAKTTSLKTAAKLLGCSHEGVRGRVKKSPRLQALADEQAERRRHQKVFGKAAE